MYHSTETSGGAKDHVKYPFSKKNLKCSKTKQLIGSWANACLFILNINAKNIRWKAAVQQASYSMDRGANSLTSPDVVP